ncbi:MAG: patatin-like phospholipase family protein [Pseudonocardiaceae bacterium]
MRSADLVLEGGGVKGIALAGAITVLMERGYEFNRIAGTSAGSIVGALVAAGFRRDELVSAVDSIDYRKFRDGHSWDHLAVGKMFQLATEHGVYEGHYLTTWLGAQLATHDVHTFADLRCADDQPPGSESDRAYRLVVNVSDITTGCLRQLPWDYRQHYQRDPAAQPVVDAVRGSMSIPFFYQPAVITDGDGVQHWIVDGGMLSNFPIGLFDTPPGVPPRRPTFGIKLSTQPAAVGDAVANRVHNTASMSLAMLDTMIGFYDRMHVAEPSVVARTIFVDTADIKATDFDLTDQQRDTLFTNGRNAATRFLDGTNGRSGWDWERYKKTYRAAPATTTSPA